jgi:adenylate cyclase
MISERPQVRFSLRWKIILPFLILALGLGLGATFIINQLFGQAEDVRFFRQLRDSGQQAADEVVRVEERLLEIERAIANTEGVREAVAIADAEEIRSRILSVVINSNVDVAIVLDREGTSLLASRWGDGEMPEILRGETYYKDWSFVQNVLMLGSQPTEAEDPLGNKQAGMQSIRLGDQDKHVMFVAGPLVDEGGTIFGAVLVGEYLDNLAEILSLDARSDVSVYDDSDGHWISTTFKSEETWDPPGLTVPQSLIDAARDPDGEVEPYRTISVAGQLYGEVLTPFVVRDGSQELGILGISLLGGEDPDLAYRVYQDRVAMIVRIGAVSLILIVFVGLLISNSITRPLVNIADASAQVMTGDLTTEVIEQGSDEIGLLASTFNRMIEGLRRGPVYRDLLSQTVTPQMREQMRQALAQGDTLVRGQSVRATVLYAGFEGLPSVLEVEDPTQVMNSLNQFISGLIPIILQHGGVVSQFDGESLLAFFGVLPRAIPPQVSSLQATHAGLEIIEFTKGLNRVLSEKGHPSFEIGIGIASGAVIAGGVGTKDRLHFTLIGDTVNSAKAVQQATREPESGGLLIAEDTYAYLANVRDQFFFGRQGRVKIQAGELTVHEVKGRSVRLVDEAGREAEEGPLWETDLG